jgi:hypothetical protein
MRAAVAIAIRCHCGAVGAFGYKTKRGTMQWFCAQHRLRQWSADACIDKAEASRALADLMRSPTAPDRPPDLQELIERADRRYAQSIGEEYIEDPLCRMKEAPHQAGWQHITEAEWAEYDRAMEEWQTQRREK